MYEVKKDKRKDRKKLEVGSTS